MSPEQINKNTNITLVPMEPEQNTMIQKIKIVFSEVILPFLRVTSTDLTDDFYFPNTLVQPDQSQSLMRPSESDASILVSDMTTQTTNSRKMSHNIKKFEAPYAIFSSELEKGIEVVSGGLVPLSPKSRIFETKQLETLRERQIGSVPCRYSTSGCKESVIPGSVFEKEHSKRCDFRPIECIFECGLDIPYHSFLIHLHQHMLYPTYGSKLITSVIVHAEDFMSGGMWSPKWLSIQGHHFFLMLRRVEDGLWASWVWFLGNDSEAKDFSSRITIFKGTKCITGTYPVYSIRTTSDDIQKTGKGCLFTSDVVMKAITKIEKNSVTDLAMHVHVYPTPAEEDVIGNKGIAYCQNIHGIPESLESQVFYSMNSAMLKVSSFVQSFSSKLAKVSEGNWF